LPVRSAGLKLAECFPKAKIQSVPLVGSFCLYSSEQDVFNTDHRSMNHDFRFEPPMYIAAYVQYCTVLAITADSWLDAVAVERESQTDLRNCRESTAVSLFPGKSRKQPPRYLDD
jgi:hypothetical protein